MHMKIQKGYILDLLNRIQLWVTLFSKFSVMSSYFFYDERMQFIELKKKKGNRFSFH